MLCLHGYIVDYFDSFLIRFDKYTTHNTSFNNEGVYYSLWSNWQGAWLKFGIVTRRLSVRILPFPNLCFLQGFLEVLILWLLNVGFKGVVVLYECMNDTRKHYVAGRLEWELQYSTDWENWWNGAKNSIYTWKIGTRAYINTEHIILVRKCFEFFLYGRFLGGVLGFFLKNPSILNKIFVKEYALTPKTPPWIRLCLHTTETY